MYVVERKEMEGGGGFVRRVVGKISKKDKWLGDEPWSGLWMGKGRIVSW